MPRSIPIDSTNNLDLLASTALGSQALLRVHPEPAKSQRGRHLPAKNVYVRGLKDCTDQSISTLHQLARRFATYQGSLLNLTHQIVRPNDPALIVLSRTSSFTDQLIHALSMDFDKIRAHHPLHEMSPIFEAFACVARRFQIDWWSVTRSSHEEGHGKWIKRAFETAARVLQKRLRASHLQRALVKFRRGALKNYQSVLRYMDSCLQRRSNVTIIRLDLHFNKRIEELHCTKVPTKLRPVIDDKTMSEIHDDRRAFFNIVRKRLGAGLLGYVWKVEHGPERKFHIHVLLILDAAKHQEDISLGKMLGEEWSNSVAPGQGTYFNCNSAKGLYQWCALGKVDATDVRVQKGLRFIAAYMTLGELFIKPSFARNSRCLGRGQAYTTSKSKVGRPSRYVPGSLRPKVSEDIRKISFI